MICTYEQGVIPGTPSSDQSVWCVDRTFKIGCGARCVVWNHGHGGTAISGVLDSFQTPRDPAMLAGPSFGMPLLSLDDSGQQYANDQAQADLLAALNWLRDVKGCGSKHIIGGVSMGSGLACNFAARHPDRVQALLLAYPWVDWQWWLDHAGIGSDAQIAYGTPGSNTGVQNAINANPSYSPLKLAQAGLLSQVPIRGYVSSNDVTVGGYTAWTPFADAIVAAGGTRPTDYNLGAVGHGDDTLLPQADIAAWLRSVA